MTNQDVLDRAQATWDQFQLEDQSLSYTGCRLVQYSGLECCGSMEVPLSELEMQIKGAICEGFGVDWKVASEGTLFLCIWESIAPLLNWEAIFAQKDFDG
jgi:hypothetical protein